jgi:hypothetical protein
MKVYKKEREENIPYFGQYVNDAAVRFIGKN